MNWSIILQSAIISAVVSVLGNIYLKKLEFKYNYRSFILTNRQQAYKEVEKVITELLIKTRFTISKTDGTQEEIFEIEFLKDRELLNDFYAKIISLMKYNFWFSKNMYTQINKLYATVGFFYAEYDKLVEMRKLSGIAMFTDRNNELDKCYNALSKQFLLDIKTLKNLDFLKK